MKVSKQDKQRLSKALGDTNAKELIKLTAKFDRYVLKFKEDVNKVLEPANLVVSVGVSFGPPKESPKQE